MKITTNNHKLPLLSGYDLTPAERAELDYIENIDETYARFFRYRGNIYDTQEFVRIVPLAQQSGWAHGADAESLLLKWDGIQADSCFSAVVLRYVPDTDFEEINVGLALS